MSEVNSFFDVKERLFSTYSHSLPNILLGVWVQLVIFGEEETKKNMCKSTYFRCLCQLKKAGVTWKKIDILDYKKDIQMVDELNSIKVMLRKGVNESLVNQGLREKIMLKIGRVKAWLYLDKKLKRAYVNKKACSCINNYTPRAENFDVVSTVR